MPSAQPFVESPVSCFPYGSLGRNPPRDGRSCAALAGSKSSAKPAPLKGRDAGSCATSLGTLFEFVMFIVVWY